MRVLRTRNGYLGLVLGAALALAGGAAGCGDDDSGNCTVTDNGDGTYDLTCGDNTVTLHDGQPGIDGDDCTVVDNGDGSYDVTCGEATTTLFDGQNGDPGVDGDDCTVADNGDGSYTVTCGTSTATLFDGQNAAHVVHWQAQTFDALSTTITSASVVGNHPVVQFEVLDPIGRGVVGLRAGSSGRLRFIIAKLQEGTNGDPDTWQSYINRTETPTAGVGTETTPRTQATTENNGTLVDNEDGTYEYTFNVDLSAVTDPTTSAPIAYDPALTHRIAIQLSGGGLPVQNPTYDFVPGGGQVTLTREIAMIITCNECHSKLSLHGGGRTELKYCVTCHNPGTTDANSGNVLDMPQMIHKIHRGANLAGGYTIWGYGNSEHDYSEVGYPQDITNCRKCHSADDPATTEGGNWNTKPTMAACGSCHEITFAGTSPTHSGGGQADNSMCANCHNATSVQGYHLTENATPNNPDVPTGLSNFTYEIMSVTVNGSGNPVVTFRIQRDGAPMDVTTLPADLTGGPSFLLAYGAPQAGATSVADWNHLGRSAAQPLTVSLANLRAGTAGTLAADSGNPGYYIATMTGTNAFPANATMRAVALQGYFSQTVGTASVGRHTVSVIEPVAGDPQRRMVVDSAKCANCHEWFEGHGGNRVYTVEVCATCHNPNLTSSGRSADPATALARLDDGSEAAMAALGIDPANPLTYPEKSNNLKDMIHAIHASHDRSTHFNFVRDRGNSGLYWYDFSHVTFPGQTSSCETCHASGTFETTDVPADALPTTWAVPADPALVENRTTILAARGTVGSNDWDIVSSPVSSTCWSCHDTPLAAAHMELNGGAVLWTRAEYVADPPVETCSVCHGPGSLADVATVHGN